MPVWWGRHLPRFVVGFLVQRCITGPSDTIIGHHEWSWGVAARSIDRDRAEDGVVEDGVGDQTTWVECLSVRCQSQGIAGAATYCIIVLCIALELIGIEGLDVSSVVLIEVGEAVVQVNVRANIVRDTELKGADSGVGDVHGTVGWTS